MFIAEEWFLCDNAFVIFRFFLCIFFYTELSYFEKILSPSRTNGLVWERELDLEFLGCKKKKKSFTEHNQCSMTQ